MWHSQELWHWNLFDCFIPWFMCGFYFAFSWLTVLLPKVINTCVLKWVIWLDPCDMHASLSIIDSHSPHTWVFVVASFDCILSAFFSHRRKSIYLINFNFFPCVIVDHSGLYTNLCYLDIFFSMFFVVDCYRHFNRASKTPHATGLTQINTNALSNYTWDSLVWIDIAGFSVLLFALLQSSIFHTRISYVLCIMVWRCCKRACKSACMSTALMELIYEYR